MRLKELEVNHITNRLELEVFKNSTNFAIIVCDGEIKMAELPNYGEVKIITHQGKVKKVKFDEGEDF